METVGISSSFAALSIRIAISDRFAINIFVIFRPVLMVLRFLIPIFRGKPSGRPTSAVNMTIEISSTERSMDAPVRYGQVYNLLPDATAEL